MTALWECTTLYSDRNPEADILVHMASASAAQLKTDVAEFWNAEPCGTRYLNSHDDFESHAAERYRLEPYISEFAGFAEARGRRVLEIGVGMGADYSQWLKAGAIATGVDISAESVARTTARCVRSRLSPDLRVADAENLPFPDQSFDIVYSYGVMHHSPDTARCLAEAWRVLKPGGSARIMLYHHPSLTGIMLWLRYGVWRGQFIRRSVYERLESPGTKTFSKGEVLSLMREFENVSIRQVFSPGDLLMNKPSAKFQGPTYRAIWRMFPRRLIRFFGRSLGLFLLISAEKPTSSEVSD